MAKTAVLLIGIVFMFSQGIGCAQNAQVINQPVSQDKEQINDPFTWHFGDINSGDIVEHDFELKNTGSKALNILSWNTSCGCTVSDIAKKNLQPGESTIIHVKFDSKNYGNEILQYIYVNTDDAVNPVLKYKIIARVHKK